MELLMFENLQKYMCVFTRENVFWNMLLFYFSELLKHLQSQKNTLDKILKNHNGK